MQLVTCVMCGKLFQTIDKKVCPLCAKKEEEYFTTVKKHLKENPGIRLDDVVKQTGVPASLMRRWLREGRLKVSNTDGMDLRCDRCGKQILQGKYCVACRDKMKNTLNDLYKPEYKDIRKYDGRQKMRFLEKD